MGHGLWVMGSRFPGQGEGAAHSVHQEVGTKWRVMGSGCALGSVPGRAWLLG